VADEPVEQAQVTAVTIDIALGNASRLLNNAEIETNLALMERLERLADSWVSIARIALDRDR